MLDAVLLIPARYHSVRFPGKALAPLKNRPLVQWTYENAVQTGLPTYVVTDDERIEQAVRDFGGEVLRVDDEVESGSQRIYLAYERYLKKLDVQLLVNLQGDEPLMKAELLRQLIDFHLPSSFDITTVVRPRVGDKEGFLHPHTVKAVWDQKDQRCWYFSRAGVPYPRNDQLETWYQHIGLYSYRPSALKKFCETAVHPFEQTEGLEQLRALGLGQTIGAIAHDGILLGVDTPEDLKKVEDVLDEKKI